MKIATWNINSLRVRVEQLTDFLHENDIEVILLQEIKCKTEEFPKYIFEELGYNCSIFGQKAYNGVAILSKYLIEEVVFGNDIFQNDEQARYVEALINGYKIASVYVPNGKSPGDPAYNYKLNFLKILLNHLKINCENDKYIIGGDFNITMSDADVYDPNLWRNKICCTDLERKKLSEFKALGYADVMNDLLDAPDLYTWWDYRRDSFTKNKGLRLDYFFMKSNIPVKNCEIKKEIRARIRPSDHAPVVIEI
ncbi:exodeoxyribonuclease III [Alphaproteobacteria bacterium]|nr:exodeoxyribonuclease III [Alphaproteobacteria bacterium]